MKNIQIYPCGTEVNTVIGNIRGMITACSIRFDSVQYEITHLVGDKIECVWLREPEFTTEAKKVALGYKKP
jgi:hypothetical protein